MNFIQVIYIKLKGIDLLNFSDCQFEKTDKDLIIYRNFRHLLNESKEIVLYSTLGNVEYCYSQFEPNIIDREEE